MLFRDYDSLLLYTLRCFIINKDQIGKNNKLDDNMSAILGNIRGRLEKICSVYNSSDRSFPFSYERIFEILVYYLRLITNSLRSDKDKPAQYITADISPEAVLFTLNRKLTVKNLDSRWEKDGWKAFYKEIKPLSAGDIDYYIKFILLSTYIRYHEIRDN